MFSNIQRGVLRKKRSAGVVYALLCVPKGHSYWHVWHDSQCPCVKINGFYRFAKLSCNRWNELGCPARKRLDRLRPRCCFCRTLYTNAECITMKCRAPPFVGPPLPFSSFVSIRSAESFAAVSTAFVRDRADDTHDEPVLSRHPRRRHVRHEVGHNQEDPPRGQNRHTGRRATGAEDPQNGRVCAPGRIHRRAAAPLLNRREYDPRGG